MSDWVFSVAYITIEPSQQKISRNIDSLDEMYGSPSLKPLR